MKEVIQQIMKDLGSPGGADDRFLESMERGDRLLIVCASEDLTLTDKEAAERRFNELKLSGQIPDKCFLYFRKRSTSSSSTDGPQRSAFGLNRAVRRIPGIQKLVFVASGKGGVGKSTVTSNLATSLAASGVRTGLLDADLYGPSQTIMLGSETPLKIDADNKLIPEEKFGVKFVSMGHLTRSQEPAIWRGPMASKALLQLVYDTNWGELDVLLVDLPPGTGDVQITLIESLPVHGAVIVTTPQNIALADADKAISMFERLDIPVMGVIENMSWYECSSCGAKDHIFASEGAERVSRERRIPILGQIPLKGQIRAGGDAGRPSCLDDESIGEIFAKVGSYIKEY